ncbi:MAG: PHP domain-containing protein [Dehalococcoidia bacterium]|nr:PHP domain-containing protein [Dehalococcoidia bacterium]
MKADLHVHSTVSDGSDSIAELVIMARAKGLDAIAVTDHDTVAHFVRIPQYDDILVIGAIELSSVHRKTNTRAHVLGYGIKNPEIISIMTQPILEARNRNSEKQAEILIRHGFRIDLDKIARADGRYLYKQHLMDWLVSSGQVPNMFGDFYHKTFKNGGICAFDIEYMDVLDAVKLVKEAGGLAVLAHPGQQQNFWLIPELVQNGLDGIELNHHSHSVKDKEIVREQAALLGLFMTGGSDFHGKYEPQPFVIGDFLSDESGVQVICRC